MVFALVGSIVSDPIAVVGIWSVTGVHVVPPSSVRHTPPSAPPTKYVFAAAGLGATALTRPDEPLIGSGPRSFHVWPSACPATRSRTWHGLPAHAPASRKVRRKRLSG